MKKKRKYLEIKAAKFGMRREEDIGQAMQLHLKRLSKSVAKAKPQHIYMKTMVYWNNGNISEFDSLDEPEYVLQEVLSGKDEEVFREYGRASADASKQMKSVPVGVTVSTETIFADEIMAENGEKRKIRGLPVLLMAGRTREGKSQGMMLPLALDNKNVRYIPMTQPCGKCEPCKSGHPDLCLLRIVPPPQIVEKLETLRTEAKDFLGPFFEGYRQGGPSSKKISLVPW